MVEGLSPQPGPGFWAGRRVLLTGHTGFKGGWMALMLERLGANVTGVALAPNTTPNFVELTGPWNGVASILCDIRDRKGLAEIVSKAAPEIVIHLAAQALVRESYDDAVGTIETNVLGTVHLLEALRSVPGTVAVLVVTSDKVYENRGGAASFPEHAPLGGHDPYSASKAATEIVTSAYARSFFDSGRTKVCTARAGNVIGGGDWARDRIIPDLWRGYSEGRVVELRNPGAVRPWQHVLDPLYGYLLFLRMMIEAPRSAPGALNFGPADGPPVTVQDIAERFCRVLGIDGLTKIGASDASKPESPFLAIDPSLAMKTLDWRPQLPVNEAVGWTCEWYKAYRDGRNMREFSIGQIEAFEALTHSSTLQFTRRSKHDLARP
jgi:CDP-glucose 4,6-dehydratase